jgi:hypothetical protein
MNIDFNDAKKHFIEKGYCSFNIKDFDLEFYNFIEKFLICDDKKNLRELFHSFRYDDINTSIRYTSPIRSFYDAKEKQLELINNCKNDDEISQVWYLENNLQYVNSFLNKIDNISLLGGDINLEKIIVKATNNILKYFYDNIDESKLMHDELQFSYYDINNRFKPHSDGMTVNLCSILIYLNKNYKEENGGILLLNGERVIPELGMVALMDLSKHDVNHGVTKVVSGPGRYAIFNFPKLKV